MWTLIVYLIVIMIAVGFAVHATSNKEWDDENCNPIQDILKTASKVPEEKRKFPSEALIFIPGKAK